MSKFELKSVRITPDPKVAIRTITKDDSVLITKSKKKYPFLLVNDVKIIINTDRFAFEFYIDKDYVWNGADIPKFLFVFGQSKDNNYLIASMVHDYMLEKRVHIFKDILREDLSVSEYRRLTTLVFRQILKDQKTNTIKANIMAWGVDLYQSMCSEWSLLK